MQGSDELETGADGTFSGNLGEGYASFSEEPERLQPETSNKDGPRAHFGFTSAYQSSRASLWRVGISFLCACLRACVRACAILFVRDCVRASREKV